MFDCATQLYKCLQFDCATSTPPPAALASSDAAGADQPRAGVLYGGVRPHIKMCGVCAFTCSGAAMSRLAALCGYPAGSWPARSPWAAAVSRPRAPHQPPEPAAPRGRERPERPRPSRPLHPDSESLPPLAAGSGRRRHELPGQAAESRPEPAAHQQSSRPAERREPRGVHVGLPRSCADGLVPWRRGGVFFRAPAPRLSLSLRPPTRECAARVSAANRRASAPPFPLSLLAPRLAAAVARLGAGAGAGPV